MIHHTDFYNGVDMRNNIFMMLLILFSTPGVVYSIGKDNNTTWVYNNVSYVDLFGKHDSDIINFLDEKYRKVVVDINEKNLKIRNYSLKNTLVCSVDYVELKKSPLAYYLSQATVNMYMELFKHEGVVFPKEILILTSLYPEHECPVPYNEVIKINNQLMILDKYYVLFFKDEKKMSRVEGEISKKESWSTYCHDKNPEEIFDGTSKEYCYFKSLDLKKSYDKLLEVSNYGRDFLKKKLPVGNSSYRIHDKTVTYEWVSGKLNISVVMENEKINYFFNEQPSGVNVEITYHTQY